MSTNSFSPLRFVDLKNIPHIEPSVTSLSQVQTAEPIPPGAPPTDLILISPFRSGKPQELKRFLTISSLRDVHDPDQNGDEGVALALVARSGLADDDVFGAAAIQTVRVDQATNSSATLLAGAAELLQIETGDYGAHTVRARAVVEDGTVQGKKLTLSDDVRVFIGDNLGVVMTLIYEGDSATATVTITSANGRVTYTKLPTAGDQITVNDTVVQFVAGTPTGNQVQIVALDSHATWAAFAAFVGGSVPNIDSAANTETGGTAGTGTGYVVITGAEHGVTLLETTDTGAAYAVSHSLPSSRLRTTLTGAQTDGSVNLDIPLTLTSYKSIDRVASYISQQVGYTATLSAFADKFLLATGLDSVTTLNIKTVQSLTAYTASMANWINTHTRGAFIATEIERGEPDEDSYEFTGGTTPPLVFSHWTDALEVVGAGVERGGIILINTDDPATLAYAAAFINEQRDQLGKNFRLYAGLAPALTNDEILRQVSTLDNARCHVTVDRVGVYDESNQITFLHPVYAAAALAGGASGNFPFRKPLTNKRLRFAGLHPDDAARSLVSRESLLSGGVTVLKKDRDVIVVSLHVTTSRDPIKRMVRIASEIATVDQIDETMIEAYRQFKGTWATADIAARVFLVGRRVLDGFKAQGAISEGVDESGNPVPAWRWQPMDGNLPFVLQAGVLKLSYQVFLGGELDHISLHGLYEYQRFVADIGQGGLVNLTTSVPIR